MSETAEPPVAAAYVPASPIPAPPYPAFQGFVPPGTPGTDDLWRKIEESQADIAITFNRKALNLVADIGDADKIASRQRFVVMVILAVVVVGGTLAIIAGIMLASNAETISVVLASSGVIITTLVVAGITNPLQTIERDVVVRRWSDVILSSFLLQAGSFDLKDNAEYRRTAARASKDFAALAAVLGAAHGRTLDALLAVLNTTSTEDNATAAALTLVNPGDQQSTLTQIKAFTLAGEGPDPLTYGLEGGPPGITVNADTGEVSGTPTTVGAYTTTASVTSPGGDSHSVQFTWTVN